MARESKARSNRVSDLSYDDAPPRKDGSLFLWTVAILLLIGFAIACWIFSFYIFGHPEKPLSYKILTKLKKLEDPKRFELTAAPQGEFLNAQQLWDRYNKMSNRELERASETLLRNYLRNYKLTRDKVPYVIGSYNILDSNELTASNMFPSGVAALAQSTTVPQVLLEQVLTADQRAIPLLHRTLLTGLNLRLDKNLDLSALINVVRLQDGRLQFTAIPLLYGDYAASTGSGMFSLTPPTTLNMAAGLPVFNSQGVTDAEQKLNEHRLRAGLNPTKGDEPSRLQSGLVRVERPQPANGTAAPTPPPVVPTPTPEVEKLVMVAEAVATPTPAASATPDVPLQPFISPSPTPGGSIATTAGGAWPTYAPGQMPRGRLVGVPDTSSFAERGAPDERTYLQGTFVVTAAGANRAVLRAQGGLSESLGLGGRKSSVRVIVEFPQGARPPSEGSTFSRDSRRPFLITRVEKTRSGEINVYAQEVTKP